MMSILFGCVAVTLSTLQAETEPCAVFFYGAYSQPELEFRREAAEQFNLELDELTSRSLRRPDFYKYDVPEGFVRREGIGYFLLPGRSELMVVRFVPVPSKDAFGQLVDHTSKMLGPDTKVHGTSSQKRLTPTEGNVEYLRYDPRGIAVIGWSRDLLELDLDGLVDAHKRLKGKHSLFSVNLGVVPKHKRLGVLEQIRDQQSLKLQQRDDEPDRQYEKRRLLGESWFGMTDLLLTEATEATWWLSLPQGDKPMRAGAIVRFARNGRLAKYVRNMTPTRNRIQIANEKKTAAATVSVNVALNAATENVLKALAEKLPLEWAQLVARFVQPNLELHAALTDFGVGEPVMLICTPHSGDLQSSELPELEIPSFGKILSVVRRSTLGHTKVASLQFARSELGDTSVPPEDVFSAGGANRRAKWIDARVRLSLWNSRLDGSGSETFLQSLERAYDQWHFDRFVGAMRRGMSERMMSRMYRYKPKLDEADFRSLVGEIGRDDLWDAKASIGPRGNTVVAEVEVGADLYRWFVARQMLTAMRLRKKER